MEIIAGTSLVVGDNSSTTVLLMMISFLEIDKIENIKTVFCCVCLFLCSSYC